MKQKTTILVLIILFFSACKKEPVIQIYKPDFEVFVLLPVEGLGDRSFVDITYEGVETAFIDFKFRVNYIVPKNLDEAKSWINALADLERTDGLNTLVIIAGNQYENSLKALNGHFGSHKILFINGSFDENEGLASVTYQTFAPSYIGGYLSAQLKPNCRAMVIAGFDAPFYKDFDQGFKQGVIDAGGSIHESAYISNDFSGFAMADSAYRLTEQLLSENDLIFALACGSNMGIINAARNYSEQRYVIGLDSDQSWMGLNVVTGSVISLIGDDIYNYIEAFSHGTFESGDFIRTMEDGATTFLINEIVMGDAGIPENLIQRSIQKEKEYLLNRDSFSKSSNFYNKK